MKDQTRLDAVCAAVVKARPEVEVPPWFAARVMAHVRERSADVLDSWFLRRVAAPIMAGGGLASAAMAWGWAWFGRASALGDLSRLLTEAHWLGF